MSTICFSEQIKIWLWHKFKEILIRDLSIWSPCRIQEKAAASWEEKKGCIPDEPRFWGSFFAGSAFAPLCYFSAFPSFPQYGYQFVPLGHHLLGYSIDSQTALNIEDGHLEIASFHPIFPMEKTPKSSANMDSSWNLKKSSKKIYDKQIQTLFSLLL